MATEVQQEQKSGGVPWQRQFVPQFSGRTTWDTARAQKGKGCSTSRQLNVCMHGCPDGFPATVWKQRGACRRMNITVGTQVDKWFRTTEIPTNTSPHTEKECSESFCRPSKMEAPNKSCLSPTWVCSLPLQRSQSEWKVDRSEASAELGSKPLCQ